jgi:hypothetical protein
MKGKMRMTWRYTSLCFIKTLGFLLGKKWTCPVKIAFID